MPEPYYCTVAAVKAQPGASGLADADALAAIVAAEDLVDRIAGPRGSEPGTGGRAFDPANLAVGLFPTSAAVLADVVAQLAAARALNPSAFVARGVSTVKGPDFETTYGGVESANQLPPAGVAALRNAAAKLERAGLRNLAVRTAGR